MTRSRPPGEDDASFTFPVDMKALVADYEVGLLEEALITAQLNQKVAAELLGLTYHQLRASLKKTRPLGGGEPTTR